MVDLLRILSDEALRELSSSSSSNTLASISQAFCSSDGFVLQVQHQCLHGLYNLSKYYMDLL